jgi:hypothetical protein
MAQSRLKWQGSRRGGRLRELALSGVEGPSRAQLGSVGVLAIAVLMVLVAANAAAQKTDDRQNKSLDVKSSLGDLHLGSDADPRETGLPVYPGARLRKHDENRSSANLSLFTSEFGMKLVVLNYDSDADPSKVIAYYRDKLKKYGKVIECHTSEHGHGELVNRDPDSDKSKELKCEGDNTGNVVELKAGTEDNQHVVAIEPAENGKGATFALVYVRSRGKQADI